MRFLKKISLLLAPFAALGAFRRRADALPTPAAPANPIWEHKLTDYSDADYRFAVEQMIQQFERTANRKLVPGPKKKVGLKIYADSGPGLATPFGLVRALIASLEKRGFAKENIFLVGLNPLRLRLTGFLPSYSTGILPFPGHPVFVLESNKYYDPAWFYDSPLPARFDSILNEQAAKKAAGGKAETTVEEDRKSFLATPLFLDADFWINLPVYTDHPVLGVNGALGERHAVECEQHFPLFQESRDGPGRRGRDGGDSGAARGLGAEYRQPATVPVHRWPVFQFPLHPVRAEDLDEFGPGAAGHADAQAPQRGAAAQRLRPDLRRRRPHARICPAAGRRLDRHRQREDRAGDAVIFCRRDGPSPRGSQALRNADNSRGEGTPPPLSHYDREDRSAFASASSSRAAASVSADESGGREWAQVGAIAVFSSGIAEPAFPEAAQAIED